MPRRIIWTLTLFFIIFFTPDMYAGKILEEPMQRYCMSIPNTATADSKLPVLICLPGSGIKARQDINVWAFISDKRGFLVIDLDIDYSQEGPGGVYSRIQNVINSLPANTGINKDKVFIAGTSAGGMMALALALFYPHKFKATGIISGSRLSFEAENFLKNARSQLFYLYHGKKDKRVSIREFYATKKKLEANGAIIESKVIEEGEHTLPSGCYKEVVDWFYQLSELSQ